MHQCAYVVAILALITATASCSKIGGGSVANVSPISVEGDQEVESSSLQVTANLRIVNKSKNKITFGSQVETTCGCTLAELESTSIEPGKSTEMRFIVRYNGNRKNLVEAVLLINETKERVRIPLTVKFSKFFNCDQPFLHLESEEDRVEDLVCRLMLRYDDSINVSMIDIDTPDFVEKATLTSKSEGEAFVEAKINRAKVQKTASGQIVINTKEKTPRRIEVPVTINVLPLVEISAINEPITRDGKSSIIVRTSRPSIVEPSLVPSGLKVGKSSDYCRLHVLPVEVDPVADTKRSGSIGLSVQLQNATARIEKLVEVKW